MAVQNDDGWASTTFEGNRNDQLRRNINASYQERFQWLAETFESLKHTLPPRDPHPFGGSALEGKPDKEAPIAAHPFSRGLIGSWVILAVVMVGWGLYLRSNPEKVKPDLVTRFLEIFKYPNRVTVHADYETIANHDASSPFQGD